MALKEQSERNLSYGWPFSKSSKPVVNLVQPPPPSPFMSNQWNPTSKPRQSATSDDDDSSEVELLSISSGDEDSSREIGVGSGGPVQPKGRTRRALGDNGDSSGRDDRKEPRTWKMVDEAEEIMGVFNKNCTISYSAYQNIFPIWALEEYRTQKKSSCSLKLRKASTDGKVNDGIKTLVQRSVSTSTEDIGIENNINLLYCLEVKGIHYSPYHTCEGETARCNKVKKGRKVACAICIMSHPILHTNDLHFVQIILPQKQIGRKSDMYVFCCSYFHNVDSKGKYIAFVLTEAETDIPDVELKHRLDLLGPVNETFFDLYDRYEPINTNDEDNYFISTIEL